jgi:hypothetical protein
MADDQIGELFSSLDDGGEEVSREGSAAPRKLKITKIPLGDVMKCMRDRYNSNNHHENGFPDDYNEVLEKSEASHWIDKFQNYYYVINLQLADLGWMKEADTIGQHTMEFPKMFEDEMAVVLSKYKYVDRFFENEPRGLFVRSDRVSLKNGKHGAGPYHSLRMVIESLVSCNVKHSPLAKLKDYLKLYLLPWQDLDQDAEFRVFVRSGNVITGISQQHLYNNNETLAKMDEDLVHETLQKWAKIIFQAVDGQIKAKLSHVQDYVMDIAILDPLSENAPPYFIEMNPFVTQYSSGSSLFHWIIDEQQLYGDGTVVEFRYVYDENAEKDK